MTRKDIINLFLVAGTLLVLDWILGVLIVRRILPGWLYLIANMPLGIVYVWTEAQWSGGHYQILGMTFDDLSGVQEAAVYAQALVYSGFWRLWVTRRRRAPTPAHGDAAPSQSRAPLALLIVVLAILTWLLGSAMLAAAMVIGGTPAGASIPLQDALTGAFRFGFILAMCWTLIGFGALLLFGRRASSQRTKPSAA